MSKDLIKKAFRDNPHLQERVGIALSHPKLIPEVIDEIASHVIHLNQEIINLRFRISDVNNQRLKDIKEITEGRGAADEVEVDGIQHPAKRRKIADAGINDPERFGHDAVVGGNRSGNGNGIANDSGKDRRARETEEDQAANWSLKIKDVSFAVPVRKKLLLTIVEGRRVQGTSGAPDGGIDQVGVDFKDVDQIIAVSVPEKAQPSLNFVVIPKPNANANTNTPSEALVWSIPCAPYKPGTLEHSSAVNVQAGQGQTYESILVEELNRQLKAFGKAVVYPDAREFASSVVQAHRKGERGYHVKAFRGSKEGFLYFLSTGILFGFKKPVLFFAFSSVTSIFFSSVLQRTFNLNITASAPSSTPADPKDETIEFAMLDQTDFEGVSAYVKAHGLHDASLAASRRAKLYNVNTVKSDGNAPTQNGAAPAVASREEEESELAKAERELQDAEDAEEEDFDPGSGGESDGSGSESEGEEDAAAADGDDGGDDGEEDEVEGYEEENENE